MIPSLTIQVHRLQTNSTTSVTVTPSSGTSNQGSQVTFTARVADTSSSSSIPTGIVSWSDGSSGGTFSQVSCTLSSGSCNTVYIPSTSATGSITITARYQGDSTHLTASNISTITLVALHSASLSITPNPAVVDQGLQLTFTVRVVDTSSSPTTPTGSVSWSDGNDGGTFSQVSCTLSSGNCITSYTPDPHHTATITIAANYGGDNTHSAGEITLPLTINIFHDTSTTVTPNLSWINQASQVTFTVRVADTSKSPSVPTGTVSWNDSVGGTFSPASCTLSASSCAVLYTPPAGYTGSITIGAGYAGDDTHSASTSKSSLRVNMPHGTDVVITPNPATVIQGSEVTFTAKISDTTSLPTTFHCISPSGWCDTFADKSSLPSIPTGTVSWSDGNAGGTFNLTTCTLESGVCTVSYTPPASSTNSVTVNATYSGDGSHSRAFGTSQLSTIVLPDSLSFSADQSYYTFDDVATLSVNLPGQGLQNIAIGVSDPKGDNIISRTVTTDENGTGSLQFKIPDNYQTGVYQEVATAVVAGRHYTNSTEFTIIKSHGISIDSVQITNQQGDSVSMLKKSQNGFVKVSLSSDEKMPALLTLNLFDSNQNSLGTASIKSIINSGKSELTLSFFIPSDAQVGLANVFTDAYSDWPGNGGTPLTVESCLAADLQDPSTLPVSYTPNPPHVCAADENGTALGNVNAHNVKMTNDQALVTLGVVISNDSMTFMSPAQAHLLALAYAKDSTTNARKSIELVSFNLDNMDTTSRGVKSGNVTKIGPTQFTTLAGPDLLNNPMAVKILQEIEASKRQVANILGNETLTKLNQQLIKQQRQVAADKLKEDLISFEKMNANNTSNAAYARFLATVSDNRTKAVFQSEFDFMKQRVSAANSAMQAVLNSGGSWDEAIQTFYRYAKINHVQVINLNNQLNVAYGLADSRIQSCFDKNGHLGVINGVNPCVADIENNSFGPSGISIVSVQPTDKQGNPVSLLKKGHTGYVKVVLDSNASPQSLVTINIFDSNISGLGTVSAQYTLNPGQSEVVLPYYVPAQAEPGLASIYANVFTDWAAKGGTSQSNEVSYFVGLS
ncbi:MAG: hypothetical protein E6K91_08685 [Thaumarchaeota archaeon]|nr:MAG: hypothetical protein E6K91_08685 [Nitrososphaerota archaeon]